jgi:hypothetical protein
MSTTIAGRFGGRGRILFIGGALNQTKIAHAVAGHLPEFDAWFSPCYADSGLVGRLSKRNLLEWTALGGVMRQSSLAYLRDHGLRIDEGGRLQPYDLVVATTDLIVPRNIGDTPMVLLQEGMTDPENLVYSAVRRLGLPRYLASTATFGLSHRYEYLCAASDGYKQLFIDKGVAADRIVVTGLPHWDDLAAPMDASWFPHRGHVLVATSDARETFKVDRRKRFLRRCLEIADGRELVFKLHPNENRRRAEEEIEEIAPGSVVYAGGDINPMIATASELITQYSTVVYVGIAAGIPVHSYFDTDLLTRLMPLQTGGRSAALMAAVCRTVMSSHSARKELVDVCQCRDCRAGARGLHASAG